MTTGEVPPHDASSVSASNANRAALEAQIADMRKDVCEHLHNLESRSRAESEAAAARDLSNDKRFERIEGEVADHRKELGDHRNAIKDQRAQLDEHNKLFREQAIALTNVAASAARAADAALEAKREASRSRDEAVTIVESAIRMHGASIASTVTVAVSAAVVPLVNEVDKLKTGATLTAETLTEQGKTLDSILVIAKSTAKLLGGKKLRAVVLVCVAAGTIVGSGVAGYYAHAGADVTVTSPVAKPSAPPSERTP